MMNAIITQSNTPIVGLPNKKKEEPSLAISLNDATTELKGNE